MSELVEDGTWPSEGRKDLGELPVQLALGWHPRFLYQKFHVTDLWLDELAMKSAVERQRQVHLRQIRTRWMPARVDSVEYGKFGHAKMIVSLFGGMDASLYADFRPGLGGQMAVAENTLRTFWPDHDGMEGRIVSVQKSDGEPEAGSSGIQIGFEVNLVLEGFRPGRTVRIRPQSWPKVKPPTEETIRRVEERWPGTEMFRN
jgi:hypothetical protein